MSRPVAYLHIGAMKTGTTYLQELIVANREVLEASGHHFAGASWSRQVRAAQDLLGLDQHDPQIAALSDGAWAELVAEIRGRHDGVTLVSMEFLSFASRRQVARIARDLDGVDLHVVLTVRDARATIPAQWQTSVASASTHTWTQFQAGVRRSTSPVWQAHALRGDTGVREFRRTQDVASMLRRWGHVVPPERLHVVTVPVERTHESQLWGRFAEVVGAPADAVSEPAGKANESLGHASTELVRRLNVALGETLPWDYNRTVKAPLGSRILGARRDLEPRPSLDAATERFASAWNQRTAAAIRRSGAHLVGTLDDLPLTVHDAVPADPVDGVPQGLDPADADVVDAARDAWLGLVDLVEQRRRRVARLMGARRPAALAPDPPSWMTHGSGSAVDLSGAVRDLTALVRTAMQLRRESMELRESDDESGDDAV